MNTIGCEPYETCSSARKQVAPYPRSGSIVTVAPAASAIATVLSVEPLSATMIFSNSPGGMLAKVAPMTASSLRAGIIRMAFALILS